MLQHAIVEELVTDIMALMFIYEEPHEDESEIPPENEDQETLVEEVVELVSSPYPQVAVSYDILVLLEDLTTS